MKSKKLIVLVVILLLLGALALFKRSAGPAKETLTVEAGQTSVGPAFNASSAAHLEIRRGDSERLALLKDASGKWTLTSHHGTRARKESVEALLGKLSGLRGELRAEDAGLLEDFTLTDEKAFHFEAAGPGDEKLTHLLVSPLRPRGTQNFVRVEGSVAVFVTDSDLLADIGIFSDADELHSRSFSDLRVAGVDSSKVEAFELVVPGQKKLSFAKKSGEPVSWSLAEDASAQIDTSLVNQFFAAVYNLYANECVDPAGREKDFTGEPWLKILSNGPETTEVYVGPRLTGKETMLIRTMPDGLVYEIQTHQVDALLKKNKDSFMKPKGG